MRAAVIQETDFNSSEHPIAVNEYGIPSWLIENLTSSFTHWMAIQATLIPLILAGKSDLIVNAPTGSGKTIAYLVPVLSKLSTRIVPAVRALIIVPTRDLATQIHHVALALIKGSNLRVSLLGNASTKFSAEQQVISYGSTETIERFFQPTDIIITTPSKLVDHLNSTPGFHLANLKFLIFDEADRVLENATSNGWIDLVLKSQSNDALKWKPTSQVASTFASLLSKESSANDLIADEGNCLKLLFSATITKNPLKLSILKLSEPQIISLVSGDFTKPAEYDALNLSAELQSLESAPKYQAPLSLKEVFSIVRLEFKPLYLLSILRNSAVSAALVFTNSVQSTERLVCSDGLARGIDFSAPSLVINYDMAAHPRTYIHRIGRTARAGKEGCAHSLITPSEVRFFNRMMEKINRAHPIEKTYLETPSQALIDLLNTSVEQLSATKPQSK